MESKSARALSPDELRGILDAMRSSQIVLSAANKVTPKQTLSEYCSAADLTDVVTIFPSTGARISEVLGIRRQDIDFTAKTVTISGKVNRVPGQGMIRESFTKTAAGLRVLPQRRAQYVKKRPFSLNVAAMCKELCTAYPQGRAWYTSPKCRHAKPIPRSRRLAIQFVGFPLDRVLKTAAGQKRIASGLLFL
jgi:integrase